MEIVVEALDIVGIERARNQIRELKFELHPELEIRVPVSNKRKRGKRR
jgi:hypothetical protein